MVIVEARVEDLNGSPVSNLSHDRFKVYEDGKRQDIVYFTNKGEPESKQEGSPIKYKLGYYPPPANADWEFRRVRVKVRNGKSDGISITFDPEGYFLPPRDWVSN